MGAFLRVLFARALQTASVVSTILVCRRRGHILVGIDASLIQILTITVNVACFIQAVFLSNLNMISQVLFKLGGSDYLEPPRNALHFLLL